MPQQSCKKNHEMLLTMFRINKLELALYDAVAKFNDGRQAAIDVLKRVIRAERKKNRDVIQKQIEGNIYKAGT